MFYRPWEVSRPDKEKSLAFARAHSLPRLVCDVLFSRGKATEAAVQEVLGTNQTLSDPMLMHGMDAAVQRILHAADNGERIVVFGDYDVDGVTATAL